MCVCERERERKSHFSYFYFKEPPPSIGLVKGVIGHLFV